MEQQPKEDWSEWVSKFQQNSPNVEVTIEEVQINYLPIAGKKIWLLQNVMTEEECNDIITMTEALGYRPMREYDRVMSTQEELSKTIFERVKHLLPETFNNTWMIQGLNEKFRFCKYIPGQHFSPHCDACFRRSPTERSYLTFMIYLNGDFTGGHTRFLTTSGNVLKEIHAQPGMVLCFQHDIFHDGERLEEGTKYLMRTDVMYKK